MPVSGTTGYQHSLSDIRGYVRDLLMQESGDSHWRNDRLNRYINLALDDIRLKGIRELANYSFYSEADMQTWTPPSDVWKITHIHYDDERLNQITPHDMDNITSGDWDVNSGTPENWFDDGQYIWFDKRCSEAGKVVRVDYWRRPQNLSADTDLSGLYKVTLPVIAYRAVQLAKLADEKGSAAAWEREFREAVIDVQLHMVSLHESDAVRTHDPQGWSDYF